jgi:NADH:ubiquinone oxidoreductase subunit 5 (subunit L)/multisubunit Na+/H+ antiporter MnhA subunit
MEKLLMLFIIIPNLGLLISLIPDKTKEKSIYYIALVTVALCLLLSLTFAASFMLNGGQPFYQDLFTYYRYGHSSLSFELYFDKLSMIYSIVGFILGMLVIRFSRFYMHRDKGFKRFFNNILFFYIGLNFVLFAGNFETIFIGWEILGISSFFLIGFYRLRYLPVKNAMKVVSLYRLSDISLVLAVWLCHLAFEKNVNFVELTNSHEWADLLVKNPIFFYLVPFFFLMVAAIKSAQLPFSSWLPRAMEGPTTSTAIFYGALSVHIGIFLMLRVEPLWADKITFRIFLGVLGLVTSIVTSTISSVQSSVKTQIAYSSISQIGIMFIELAFGFYNLALIHFAGNAFLRAYQLLVSPSVLNYLIHDQYFNFETPKDTSWFMVGHKFKSAIFILSIKEWNLDRFHYLVLWKPFKILGNLFSGLVHTWSNVVIAVVLVLGYVGFYSGYSIELESFSDIFTFGFAILSFVTILFAFIDRTDAKRAWLFIFVSQLFLVLSAAYNHSLSISESFIYLSGVLLAGLVGVLCLQRLYNLEKFHDMKGYYGHIYEHPKMGLVFLFAGLAISGFPITPTFIGMDILYNNLGHKELLLLTIYSLSLIFMEISAIRIYSRMFLGPHIKLYHPVAFRSS